MNSENYNILQSINKVLIFIKKHTNVPIIIFFNMSYILIFYTTKDSTNENRWLVCHIDNDPWFKIRLLASSNQFSAKVCYSYVRRRILSSRTRIIADSSRSNFNRTSLVFFAYFGERFYFVSYDSPTAFRSILPSLSWWAPTSVLYRVYCPVSPHIATVKFPDFFSSNFECHWFQVLHFKNDQQMAFYYKLVTMLHILYRLKERQKCFHWKKHAYLLRSLKKSRWKRRLRE